MKKRMAIDVFVIIGLQSVYGVKHGEWWARHDDRREGIHYGKL
jgi:hypothetical protein